MRILIIPILIGFILLIVAVASVVSTTDFGGDSVGEGGVYKSTDGGESFERMENIVTENEEGEEEERMLDTEIDQFLFGTDNEELWVIAPNEGFLRSTDGAENWNIVFNGNISPHTFAVNPQNEEELYLGFGGDGRARVRHRMPRDDQDPVDDEESEYEWEEIYVDGESGRRIAGLEVHPQNPDELFLLFSDGTMLRSFNRGRDWVFATDIGASINSLYMTPGNPDELLAFSGSQIYISNDRGFSFESRDIGNVEDSGGVVQYGQQRSSGINNVTAFHINRNNSQEIYIGTVGRMIRSPDQGQSWQDIDIITPTSNIAIQGIFTYPPNTDRLYYVAGNVLYTSRDRGDSWNTKELPPEISEVTQVLVDRENNDIIYIAAR